MQDHLVCKLISLLLIQQTKQLIDAIDNVETKSPEDVAAVTSAVADVMELPASPDTQV